MRGFGWVQNYHRIMELFRNNFRVNIIFQIYLDSEIVITI